MAMAVDAGDEEDGSEEGDAEACGVGSAEYGSTRIINIDYQNLIHKNNTANIGVLGHITLYPPPTPVSS
jgi:hypothetical protein